MRGNRAGGLDSSQHLLLSSDFVHKNPTPLVNSDFKIDTDQTPEEFFLEFICSLRLVNSFKVGAEDFIV